MGAFTRLRGQRRLSGCVVVALLMLGAIASTHHHRLVVPADALAIGAGESFEAASRSTDCVICRAADPARIEIAQLAMPRVLVVSFVAPTLTERATPAAFRPCSPRAPPVAAA
jgi:hypothetical protein